MRLSPLPLLLVAGLAMAADPTVEESLLAPSQALRHNDIVALFKSLPPEVQTEADANWKDMPKDAKSDAQIDGVLGLLLSPNAADTLMVMLEPQLKQFNAQETAGQLAVAGGFLAMAAAGNPDQAEAVQAVQAIIADLGTWLPKAGLEDPEKAKQAIAHVIEAAKGLKVANAADLRQLSLAELMTRSGTVIKELKAVFAVYDLQADKLLDSVKITKVEGSGDKRTATIQFTAFDHPHAFPVKMKLENGRWVPDEAAMAPNAGAISQPQPSPKTEPGTAPAPR